MSIAKIEVQQSFCKNCSKCIKKELQIVKDLKNIRLYPKDSMITFNFMEANKLSEALNILSNLGYPEMGERTMTNQRSLCSC